jgi:hypothetical protein
MNLIHFTKRIALSTALILTAACTLLAQQLPQPVKLSWLNTLPAKPTGVSWGVPWPQGSVKKNTDFVLSSADGKTIPVQTWPLAYWPDGSIKWIGLAVVADSSVKSLLLTASPAKGMKSMAIKSLVTDDGNTIHINTGPLQCDIAKKGNLLIPTIMVDGKSVATDGQLECILQNKSDGDIESTAVKQKFTGNISKVIVEQSGPIRAVVRIEGSFTNAQGNRSILPFIVRLYFYANTQSIRMVHTIIYNGDEQKDFIKGLGLSFSVPFREELQNRQVRFSGEGNGIWAEPVQPLAGRRPVMANGVNVEADQVAGKRLPDIKDFPDAQKTLLHEIASWNDYKLVQSTADGFMIQKRTNNASSWLDAIGGKRSSGLVFVGDVSGGLSVALKSFWQSYPAALEITNARTAKANIKIWLWSPYNDAMDLRHYDTVAHGLNSTYEDVQAGFSTPMGVARTSEIMLYPTAAMPSNVELANEADMANNTPLLVNTPEYLHQAGAFGIWSLPDKSSPGKRWIEGQLDKALAFYKQEVDQRDWYGYWSYGDVMHTYDTERHTWKYDIGGFAWDNTELSTDMWLWYSYLRSGRADIYKMAEAMTRHTSEVDVYHIGPYAGLGSRHNVNHWGDGSKEVRESQAVLRRFYYYLTTDERTGDLMHEVALHADSGLLHVDPLREILAKSEYPTHARVGPDWFGLVGDWMTEWERTGDVKWKNKILTGVNDFAKMPYGFYSGKDAAFGYDPNTNHMYMLHKDDIGFEHLATLMGGIEMGMELKTFLNNKDWDRMFLQFCALYGAPADDVNKAFGKNIRLGETAGDYARMPAYAAYITKDPVLAKRAWDQFLPATPGRFGGGGNKFDSKLLSPSLVLKPMYEIRNVSTNSTAQWCLNAIELLQLVGDSVPDHNIAWDK